MAVVCFIIGFQLGIRFVRHQDIDILKPVQIIETAHNSRSSVLIRTPAAWPVTSLQRRLEDVGLVGIHSSLNNVFAQSNTWP